MKQYFRFLGGVLRGDFGPSLKYRNHTVANIIQQAMPVSLALGGLAFLFALLWGVPVGILCAIYHKRWPDHLGSVISLIAVCVPAFVLGPIFIMIFAVYLRWFPVGLWESPLHMILPATTLGLFFGGKVARLMREGMISALSSEFIITARSKGLSEPAIWFKHALRVAILPVVTYSGPMLADLLTGSFVVENLFQIPGMGVFMINSSLNRDYPMVVGLVLVYAVLLLLLNVIVDWLYTRLDPRIKLA
jgi:oligopeptide transport system permease protein